MVDNAKYPQFHPVDENGVIITGGAGGGATPIADISAGIDGATDIDELLARIGALDATAEDNPLAASASNNALIRGVLELLGPLNATSVTNPSAASATVLALLRGILLSLSGGSSNSVSNTPRIRFNRELVGDDPNGTFGGVVSFLQETGAAQQTHINIYLEGTVLNIPADGLTQTFEVYVRGYPGENTWFKVDEMTVTNIAQMDFAETPTSTDGKATSGAAQLILNYPTYGITVVPKNNTYNSADHVYFINLLMV